jgi:hypothetical protein
MGGSYRGAPCDELGELAPADHAYWAKQGWLDKGRRCYVPVNPAHHALSAVAEGTCGGGSAGICGKLVEEIV